MFCDTTDCASAVMSSVSCRYKEWILLAYLTILISNCHGNDILGCGGFIKSHVSLDYSKIEIGLYTKEGTLKEKTECAPTNGYYFLPIYEKGEYVLKVHPPAGWSFEPPSVKLLVDGVSDQCSMGQDLNFVFNGFGIAGRILTVGQKQGPSGVSVQLVNEKGETRNTVTDVGGDFHFTPVIPGKYTVKASHPRWKLDPSEAVVQVREGNTALPIGVLAVKGYDVRGTVSSFGNPISGLTVMLYSKEENPMYRVEGCNTALLQGVPDSPICHSITDPSGEFTFGLVPAGDYKLLALAKSPGQATVTFNIKPETVSFSVLHDSLYIKNAFEVTGFTVVGTVLTSAGGKGLKGVQVLLDAKAIGTTDAAGKYTLPSLQPGTFTVSFKHAECEIESSQVTVSGRGSVSVGGAYVARWRVCGSVRPPRAGRAHTVLITAEQPQQRQVRTVTTSETDAGKWCTYLPPGVYSAKVEVSEQELKDGLQFYPLTQKISVGHGPVDGVQFSQLKARVSGTLKCLSVCGEVPVTLRHLGQDGSPTGKPIMAIAKDGKYVFEGVLPGTVELSVKSDRLCWREERLQVTVAQERVEAPAFLQTGYVLRFHVSHELQVEYSSASGGRGLLSVPAGASQQCVPTAEEYRLTPRGCHRFQPPHTTIDNTNTVLDTIYFVAVGHAVTVRVLSPQRVDDLTLTVEAAGAGASGARDVGPLLSTQQADQYLYEHTIFMSDGEVAVVSAHSGTLLFRPAGPQQVVGRGDCQPAALTLLAEPALTLRGSLLPPVADVTVTITTPDDDLKLTYVTKEDGKYHFGPLDASKQYTVTAEKESYVFSAPDSKGDIVAHKLAEIVVELLDDADGTPLQGGVVSVSGGSYRRNAGAGAGGALRFGSLQPDDYYVKPLMKEYRFDPPHLIVPLQQGNTHKITLRGKRVAWSCVGRLVSLESRGWSGATVVAIPKVQKHHPSPPPAEEAATEPNGAFRIRGLLPGYEYTIQLKESTAPELAGLKLVKAPTSVQVVDNKDIEKVVLIAVQPSQLTDGSVVVRTPLIEHYKTLRLSLAADTSRQSPIYTVKMDAAGYTQYVNPGLLYVLPRLPADNKTYVVHLESTLSKATHTYIEATHYFVSDGKFKSFTIDFLPKVRTSEHELHQSSLMIVPFLAAVVAAFLYRDTIVTHALSLVTARASPRARAQPDRPDVLDKASIDQIVSSVNAAGKKTSKKKAL